MFPSFFDSRRCRKFYISASYVSSYFIVASHHPTPVSPAPQIGIPYIAFFVPPGAGGGTGGSPAKDALGDDLFAQAYIESKGANDRSLAQGLKGDATYLIVKDDKTLEKYGLNAGK